MPMAVSFLDRLRQDVNTVFERDPAARSTLEVILCYPGLHAIWLHRVAHWLWTRGHRLMGRLVSHVNRWLTGVEIHPGARIGERCFIDHGMGVVIGETTEIGDDCLLYQGVVLGGTSRQKGKRHPTLEDEVVVGAGAVVLGPIRIGHGARVGAGSVVVRSVPSGTTVVGIPAQAVGEGVTPDKMLEHGLLPDPISKEIQELKLRLREMELRVKGLEEAQGQTNDAPEAVAASGGPPTCKGGD